MSDFNPIKWIKDTKRNYPFLNNDFFSGFFVGGSQVLVGYPFDTIKTVFQTGEKNIGWNVYRGCSFQLINNSIVNSSLFGFNQEMHKLTNSNYLSGAVTGFIGSFVICPLEQFKVKAQLERAVRLPLYRALRPTMYRETTAYSLYFGNFGQLRDAEFSPFLAGAIAGTSSWLFTYPFDIYKTQSQAGMKFNLWCKQAWKGLPIVLLRAFIVNGVSFTLYESLMDKDN